MTQDDIDMRWNHKTLSPSVKSVNTMVGVRHIKWYIRNFITIDDPIWNGDFLAGLTSCEHVRWCTLKFPSFYWQDNAVLKQIIESCPFYGKINLDRVDRLNRYNWYHVPALYLKSSEDSISFMAGVLANGKIQKRNSGIYACYNKKALPYLKKWGIPIEFQSPKKTYNLISPLWPALFTLNMPDEGQKWLKIHHGGVKSETYAAILWRMYVSNEKMKTGGIPYLNSRRWIYYHLGSVETTEQMWLKGELSQLDKRIRMVIRSWTKII